MITLNNPFVQLTSAAILPVMVFGLLSLIWTIIIALLPGVLLLFRDCRTEQETAALRLTDVGNVSFLFAL
ncbi:MAG: hypothetical protein JNL29_09940 [Nitrospira sp.]|nr:hypothetical protein [Nitrospira sp.]